MQESQIDFKQKTTPLQQSSNRKNRKTKQSIYNSPDKFEYLHELARTKQEIEYENKFYSKVQNLMNPLGGGNNSKSAGKCNQLYNNGKLVKEKLENHR